MRLIPIIQKVGCFLHRNTGVEPTFMGREPYELAAKIPETGGFHSLVKKMDADRSMIDIPRPYIPVALGEGEGKKNVRLFLRPHHE